MELAQRAAALGINVGPANRVALVRAIQRHLGRERATASTGAMRADRAANGTHGLLEADRRVVALKPAGLAQNAQTVELSGYSGCAEG